MPTITELKWKTLTGTVNEIKSPNQFLKRMLWSNHLTVPTEDIEFSILTKLREIAPFVRKNGEGIMVSGHSSKNQSVQAPNIRIKRPFSPSELLFDRKPGTVIFNVGASAQLSALQAHIARDMQVMNDLIVNAEEWLCSQALQGTISYSVSDEEVFTITFPKPAGNNITLSTFWDDGTPGDVRLEEDVHTAKKVVSDEVGLQITDAICGTEAATQLRKLIATNTLVQFNQGRHIISGAMDFTQSFRDDGAIFLGEMYGLRWWEYPRTASLNGVSTNMIRPKYVEFVSVSAASDRVLYYGAIADMKTLQGLKFQGERFSKSWEVEDPSAMIALVHSRPLPVPRRPGATVSMKVVSG